MIPAFIAVKKVTRAELAKEYDDAEAHATNEAADAVLGSGHLPGSSVAGMDQPLSHVWCDGPGATARRLGVTKAGLLDLIKAGRSMLKNRGA